MSKYRIDRISRVTVKYYDTLDEKNRLRYLKDSRRRSSYGWCSWHRYNEAVYAAAGTRYASTNGFR